MAVATCLVPSSWYLTDTVVPTPIVPCRWVEGFSSNVISPLVPARAITKVVASINLTVPLVACLATVDCDPSSADGDSGARVAAKAATGVMLNAPLITIAAKCVSHVSFLAVATSRARPFDQTGYRPTSSP